MSATEVLTAWKLHQAFNQFRNRVVEENWSRFDVLPEVGREADPF